MKKNRKALFVLLALAVVLLSACSSSSSSGGGCGDHCTVGYGKAQRID